MDKPMQAMEPLVTLYRNHVEVCRRWADLMLDNAERFESIGRRYTRAAVAKGFSAAETATTADPTAGALALQPDPKMMEDMVSVQREMAAGMAEATQQMSKLMAEYTSTLSRTMGAGMSGMSGLPGIPGMSGMSGMAGMPAQFPQGVDSMMAFWTNASKQMTEMMQSWGQAAPQMMRAAGAAATAPSAAPRDAGRNDGEAG